jgi:hypothetical protein
MSKGVVQRQVKPRAGGHSYLSCHQNMAYQQYGASLVTKYPEM